MGPMLPPPAHIEAAPTSLSFNNKGGMRSDDQLSMLVRLISCKHRQCSVMVHAAAAMQAGVCIEADDRAIINSKPKARRESVEIKTYLDKSRHTCTVVWSTSVFIAVSQ